MEPSDIHSLNRPEPASTASDPLEEASCFEESTSSFSLFKLLLALSVPIIAISCGGSREAWALGTATILAGLCLLIAPSKQQPPMLVIGSFFLSLVWCASAFLPASLFPLPEWRELMIHGPELQLPATYSPQPWVSLEIWLFCLVGILWLNWCLGQGFHERQRRFLMQGMALFIALIALLTILLGYYNVSVPFWKESWALPYFGPFPNRNNFSAPLSVAAVLLFAATYDSNRQKRHGWILFALAVLPIFSALLLNTSRMGVVLFFGGICLWTALGSFHKQSGKRLAVTASILLGLAAMFMLFGGHILQRFTSSGNIITTLTKDNRLHILSDSLSLLSENPALGVGLGNFNAVFALTESPTQTKTSRTIHPESDWTWLLTEGGVPAFLFAVIGIWALLKNFSLWRLRSSSYRGDRRLRNAAGVGVILLLVQGLVDTPLHAMGIATMGSLLASVALSTRKPLKSASNLTKRFQQICGLFCIICGVMWILTGADKYSMPGIFGAERQVIAAKNAEKQEDYASAIKHINHAIGMQPLEWSHYYLRAIYKLKLGYSPQEALKDFALTRYLEPHHVGLCMKEAKTWLTFYPPFAAQAWREAMRRDPNQALSVYQHIVGFMDSHPELRSSLRSFATTPKLRLSYLEYATKDEFLEQLRTLLELQPDLQDLTLKERQQLFRLWYERGDRALLIKQLEEKPSWKAVGWNILGNEYASKGDFKTSYNLAKENIPVPFASALNLKSDLAELHRSFLHNPTDIARGLDLYEAQKVKGDTDNALSTLNQLSQLPGAPAKIIYEQGLMFARKEDYAKAWNNMMLYQSKVAE